MMENIISAIEKLRNLRHLEAATDEQIELAQRQLGLLFSVDFKQYLKKYGVISAKGIELTGITSSPRLNVVEVTKSERELNKIPNDLYVIENIAIEGIILLQNSLGEIYELTHNSKIQKKYNSIYEYLETEHNN
ncbi:SMI1/KNR4 family protein [Paenibacillus qinlingensis]|uniref:SMI1/KNR4 family protein n=1 Tax=Paenibacillus qinlingensis TaxID=1837343 RepID=UPI001566C49B|nr:SMI1/KNR4 family protein [Paenibacillus qinlingensis]NQX62597.1 SMI1/KNR4 family protein [Paenibacillus qinlingensis]